MSGIMSQQDIIMQMYINELRKCKKIFFERANDLNDEIADKISKPIDEDLYILKGVKLPDEEFKVKVRSVIEIVIAEYASVVKGNVVIQKEQLEYLSQGMSINELEPIKTENIDMEQQLPKIKKQIIKQALNYFNEKNKDNTMYWQRENEVKKIVKKIVELKSVGKAIINLEKIYEEVLQQMIYLQQEFIVEYMENEIDNKMSAYVKRK